MARRLRRALLALAAVAAAYLGLVLVAAAWDLLSRRDRPQAPPLTSSEVESRAGEVAMFSSHKNRAPDTYYRDAHAKAHGCVRAVFETRGGLAAPYRQGLFEQPGLHLAWIRFSKGDPAIGSDADDDAHGMAIKVMNVATPGSSQDFLMINHPVFFIASKEDYLEFVTRRSRGEPLSYFVNGWNSFHWRFRQAWIAYRMLNHEVESPLHTEYHSMSAYRFGPPGPPEQEQIAKFKAVPCSENWDEEGEIPFVDTIPEERPNHLRDRMQRYLREYRACFDLEFQIGKDSERTPKDDITVEWPRTGEGGRWQRLARVTIPDQEFDTPRQNHFCETLSFSPHHGLDAHAPVGELNDLRNHVYKALYGFRHAQNEEPAYSEPCDWCESPDWDCLEDGAETASCESTVDPVERVRCSLRIAPAPGEQSEELPWMRGGCSATS